MDLSAYTLKEHGYKHLPLEVKKAALEGFEKEQISEDVDEHHTYWREHINPNPEDCCNLRTGS